MGERERIRVQDEDSRNNTRIASTSRLGLLEGEDRGEYCDPSPSTFFPGPRAPGSQGLPGTGFGKGRAPGSPETPWVKG